MNPFALIVNKPLPCFQVDCPAVTAEQDQHGAAVVNDP
jgi:hypothetical protein